MEKDPQIVARLAAEREDENWRFRSFLKRLSLRREREACPIVFEMLERLKDASGFRRYR
jgi:hypothetical protein